MARPTGRERGSRGTTEIERERGPGHGTGDGAGAETAGTGTETDIIEEVTGGTDPVTGIVTGVTETGGDRDHVTGDNLRLRGKLKFWNWIRKPARTFFRFFKIGQTITYVLILFSLCQVVL